ncbi:MAG TPA: RDD family protein [Thermoanaerobaculia bacterium]|nr:RDD family protein [Thermoanaerobaculia bacterium]
MNCANHPAVAEHVYRCSRCGTPYCPDCLVMLAGRRYCARCKGEQLTDLRSGVDSTQIQLAGIGRRFAAIWVDGLVIGLPLMIVVFIFILPAAMEGRQEDPPAWLNWAGYLMSPFYIAYEALMLKARGQTLGKMALGIRVVQPNGQPLSSGQAWGRSIVRALFVSFLAIINYMTAFFTKEKTCIHDMAAKTRVVLAR